MSRDEELQSRDLFGICLGLQGAGVRTRIVVGQPASGNVVLIMIRVCRAMAAQMRVHLTCAVVSPVIAVSVCVHQRRAQRTDRKDGNQRQRQQPAAHSLILLATTRRVNSVTRRRRLASGDAAEGETSTPTA
jgi:hypothetical protein